MRATKLSEIIRNKVDYNDGNVNYELREFSINETSMVGMLTKHSDAGYVVISAFRGEYSFEENLKRSKKLKDDINKSGYAHIPVWGGFIENKGLPTEREVKERSFVIMNYGKGTDQSIEGSDELSELGRYLCAKYEQESYLYKPQGKEKTAYYITSNGSIDMKFNATSPSQAADEYFTSLVKSYFKNAKVKTKSFTYSEGVIYMAQSPKGMQEAIKRRGEIFFNFDI